jgi:hypothetical protein
MSGGGENLAFFKKIKKKTVETSKKGLGAGGKAVRKGAEVGKKTGKKGVELGKKGVKKTKKTLK